MAVSNFPHGFKNGITIRGVPLELAYPGRVFWVGNSATRLSNEKTAADGNDGTFLAPFSTIEGAINNSAVVANRGDVIFVRPGHTLTVASETTLALDKAGIAIIGLGHGQNRPALTHTAGSGTILVTAANISWVNFRHDVTGTHTTGVDAAFKISSTDFSMENCDFRDTGASANFLQVIQLGGGANATANQADRASFKNCAFRLLSTLGGATKSLPFQIEAVTDRLVVEGCNFMRDTDTALTGALNIGASYNVTRLLVKGCISQQTAASAAHGAGILLAGGGSGAAGSGGSGLIVDCLAAGGATGVSNARLVGINALTNGAVMRSEHRVGGGPATTAGRNIIVQTLNDMAQFS